MSHKKAITKNYVTELCEKIKRGERPGKEDEDFISRKMFIREMMPHIKSFLSEGYSYKEIAVFLEHVSGDYLKKAVAEDAENTNFQEVVTDTPKVDAAKKVAVPQTADKSQKAEKAAEVRIPCKGCAGRKLKSKK